MTSGDGGRRGRGRTTDGPSDEDLGWLAELRRAREEAASIGPGLDDDDEPPPARRHRRDPFADTPPPGWPVNRDPVSDTPPPGRRHARDPVSDTPPPGRRHARDPVSDTPPARRPAPDPVSDTPPPGRPSPRARSAAPDHSRGEHPIPHGPTTSAPALPAGPRPVPQRPRPPGGAGGRREPTTGGLPRIVNEPAGPPRPTGPPAPAGAGPITIDPLIIGRRVEQRRQLRQVQRLRAATVICTVLVILGAPLGFYVVREVTRDPVFVELDRLDLPAWAAGGHEDQATGSRWCIRECRFRQRTWQSERGPEETNGVYAQALRDNGWRPWSAPGCPQEGIEGIETCWQRDEYVLDLWIYKPDCEAQARFPGSSPSPGSAQPNAVERACPAAVVTVKVVNRIAYRAPADPPN